MERYIIHGFDTFGPFKLVGGLQKGHPTDVNINENKADCSFKHGDICYSCENGEILVVKNSQIVQTCRIADFAEKPASTFRLIKR